MQQEPIYYSNISKDKTPPFQVEKVVNMANMFFLNPTREVTHPTDLYCTCHRRYCDDVVEWSVGSNYEDGSSSCMFYGGKWYYREPINGTDSLVKGGEEEVIADLICMVAP